MIRAPPRSTLFPSPTLFRSQADGPGGFRTGLALTGGRGLGSGSHCDLGWFGVAGAGVLVAPPAHFRSRFSFSVRSVWLSLLWRSEEHTSELQSQSNLVCRLL